VIHPEYRSYFAPRALKLRKWLQAAGVSISARHRNSRPGIDVSKEFGAKRAQKKHEKGYAENVAATLARGYPKEQTRRFGSSQGIKFNKL
jgi:hypothetical protein